MVRPQFVQILVVHICQIGLKSIPWIHGRRDTLVPGQRCYDLFANVLHSGDLDVVGLVGDVEPLSKVVELSF